MQIKPLLTHHVKIHSIKINSCQGIKPMKYENVTLLNNTDLDEKLQKIIFIESGRIF